MSEFQKIAVPATRSSAALLRTRRRLVLVLLLFCVASGLIGLGVSLKASKDAANITIPSEPTRAIAIAEEAGRDFLGARDSQVPAAKDVATNWSVDASGATVETPYQVTSFAYSGRSTYTVGDKAPTTVHLIRFRVTVSDQAFNLDVPVAETAEGPVLAEAPVLLPAVAGVREAEPIDYTKMYSTAEQPPPKVTESIQRWIGVFAQAGTNDEALRDITQIQDESYSWSGLGGWTGELDTIVSAVPVGTDPESELRSGWIVQVRVVLTPPAANGPSLRSTYDVYVVTEGDPANPPVVAWGPAGSAEDLTELSNIN